MPDFWEFPTVSMGLGPINAIYQARFNRYLLNRQLRDTSRSRVWAFLGDGEMDEPEALGAIGVAAREELDNLIFVVNCNLQRLDGPVRGNGKIMQELESYFRGAGWNVIKVVWGRDWDPLLAQDVDGALVTPDEHHARTASSRPTASSPVSTSASTSSAATRGCAGWSRDCQRRRPAQAVARRPRLPQAVRGLQGGGRATRASRRSSSPTPSRAGRSAPTSRRATPRTR